MQCISVMIKCCMKDKSLSFGLCFCCELLIVFCVASVTGKGSIKVTEVMT